GDVHIVGVLLVTVTSTPSLAHPPQVPTPFPPPPNDPHRRRPPERRDDPALRRPVRAPGADQLPRHRAGGPRPRRRPLPPVPALCHRRRPHRHALRGRPPLPRLGRPRHVHVVPRPRRARG